MKQYRTVNNLMGWLTFIIAATVYCLTIEPTARFWDCPEFILYADGKFVYSICFRRNHCC